jgi:hypothetical protein
MRWLAGGRGRERPPPRIRLGIPTATAVHPRSVTGLSVLSLHLYMFIPSSNAILIPKVRAGGSKITTRTAESVCDMLPAFCDDEHGKESVGPTVAGRCMPLCAHASPHVTQNQRRGFSATFENGGVFSLCYV